ncbi:MAG: sulfite exporter TauE/SafE family protein [Acidobacteria bacterium]|nr:sulfite exporter TauE/SafE family protein [Acidobacteriota bacterium]
MPIEAWILALVITLAAALIQGVVGVGFAMVSVPLLALIDPRLAPVPQLLIAIPMTMTMAWRERGYIELQRITWIIVGRFPGGNHRSRSPRRGDAGHAGSRHRHNRSDRRRHHRVRLRGGPQFLYGVWRRRAVGNDRSCRLHRWTAARPAVRRRDRAGRPLQSLHDLLDWSVDRSRRSGLVRQHRMG